MAPSLRAIVPCRLDYREGLGALLESLCDGVEQTVRFQIISAFNEAFNNVVDHAQLRQNQPVQVEADRDAQQITVRIIDHGVAYQLELPSEQALDMEQPREDGLGLLIISRCMDRVTHERDDCNVLTMVKRLDRAAEDR